MILEKCVNQLYYHECFTRKYTTHKIHRKLHLGPEWFIFHNLTREFMDDVILVIVDDHEVLPSVEDIDVCS